MESALWVTWEYQRRNRSLSTWFEAELLEIIVPGHRLPRYLASIKQTLRALRTRRPALLFVQSPSIVLAFLAVTVGRLWTRRVIVDAHNGGIFPLEGRSKVLNFLCRFTLRLADMVLVSNGELQDALAMPNVEVLPDPLPYDIPRTAPEMPGSQRTEAAEFTVTYITRWGADEPFGEVIDAARLLPAGFVVQATGHPPPELRRADVPVNFRLLGFLSDAEYHSELCRSDVLLVLTTRQACLTCGAYEGISLAKPLILSSTAALEGYFGNGAIYTSNRAKAIRDAIVRSKAQVNMLRERSADVRGQLSQLWIEKFPVVRASVQTGALPISNQP